MDFPITELDPTSRHTGVAGRGAADTVIGSFADLLTDVSDTPVDDLFEDDLFQDDLDSLTARDDFDEDDEADAGAEDDTREDSDRARSDQDDDTQVLLADKPQSPTGETDAVSDEPSHTTTTGKTEGPDAVTPQEQLAAALAGNTTPGSASLAEARVLNRRSNALQVNAKHFAAVKSQLAKAEGAATDGAARIVDSPKPTTTAQDGTAPKSEPGRLEQAFRAAFPQTPAAATPAASPAALQNQLGPLQSRTMSFTEGLTLNGAGDTASDPGTQIQNNAERANNLAASKANAARAPFNLPGSRPAEQVSVQIQNAARNGTDRINIRLSPAALGKVEVKLELSPDKTVQAIVTAEKPETLDMLERDARTLQRALEEAGLRTNSDSLSFERRDPGSANDTASDSNGESANGASDSAEHDDGGEPVDVELSRRRHHDGLLDVEV